MARKKRKKGGGKFRPPMQVPGAGPAAIQPRAMPQARTGGDQALVRSVELSLGARNTITKAAGGRMIIQSADPSIPLDRVPYFTSDLVRLAVVGAAMVVLLGIGALIVPILVSR